MKETDFLLRCESCTPGDGKLVARYEWLDNQGHWVPVPVRGKRNVSITSLRGDEADDWWFLHLEPDELPDSLPLHAKPDGENRPLRTHHQITCGARHCGNKVAADDQSLQFIFLLIERSVVDARKPNRRDWVYLLAELAKTDQERGTTTLTLAGLRAALTLNNAKWSRYFRH
ncbi:hypothetical protein BH09ACT7_BH09ACT7_08470 [soil metagenome]